MSCTVMYTEGDTAISHDEIAFDKYSIVTLKTPLQGRF